MVTAGAAVTLQVRNVKSTGIPLRLIGDASMSPMEVTSDVMVDNLNADLLDGMEAADFAAVGHDHDSEYAGLAHTHGWADIVSGIPAGLADGDDDSLEVVV